MNWWFEDSVMHWIELFSSFLYVYRLAIHYTDLFFLCRFFFIYSCLFVCHFHFHQNIALLTRVIPFYFICFVHTFSFLFYFSYTYYSVYYLFLFFLLCSLHPLSWTVLFALFEIVFTMCSHLSLRLSACSVTGSNVCSETQTEDINELWTW